MSVFWRSMAAVVLALLVGFGFGFGRDQGTSAAAKPASAADAFLRAADALYQAALKDDAVGVRRYARETDALLRALPMRRVASAEGVEALARSVARLKRSAASAKADPEGWRSASAEIRLAADALVHPDKPMWHRYRSVLADDLRLLREATGDPKSRPEALDRLRQLQGHYARIRTAVLLRAEPHATEKADSAFRYARRVLGAKAPDPEWIRGVAPALRESIEGLFPAQQKADTAFIAPAAGPSWGWPALMGSIIVAILSWAGWQRYRHAAPVTPRGSLPPGRRERR